ncbi:hypothetical protein FHS18_004128 [Paenibacillus phyllosphaerae]|uniref:HEAT repeat domain-containing protein n=1 Tax=Paenibacillus phyllosphaerae TaxID=274593 RepID=A0A7W5B082_9BACL|nr:HEAT repeat domain-containing protein [Paenibacillus phyllosphaerae]MBB3112050.1 hypothetical protein [Paenibacillus phyllosphaerae]
MSIAILSDLHNEVRRLFIAGSGLAEGDPRLRRLQPQLAKLGEGSPVFKRLADYVSQVIEASGDKAAVPLLALGSLLHSIMYTQGKSDAAGDPVPLVPLGCASVSQPASYRKLAPLLEALTTRGSGRVAVIRSGAEEGVFQDFRTYLPAVDGLEDVPEIADYIADHVMPAIGKPIVPIVKRKLNLQGNKGDGRKLRVLYAIAGDAELGTVELAAREGSADVRIAALGLLAGHPDYLPLLLELSADGRKEVRRAAYEALAGSASEASVSRLFEAFTGKDQEAAVQAVQACQDERLTALVVDYGFGLLQELEEKSQTADQAEGDDKAKAVKKRDTVLTHLDYTLKALHGKKGQNVYQLLCAVQMSKPFIAFSQAYIREYPVRLLLELEMPKADRFVLELKDSFEKRFIGYSLIAATRCLSAYEVYDRFAPELAKKSSGSAKLLAHTMEGLLPRVEHAVFGRAESGYDEYADTRPVELPEAFRDLRWLKQLVSSDQISLVAPFLLASPNDSEAVAYVADKLMQVHKVREPLDYAEQLLLTLLVAGYPDIPRLLVHLTSYAKMYNSYSERFVSLLGLLPASYAQQVEENAKSLHTYYKTRVTQAIERMKQNDYAEFPAYKGAEQIAWLKQQLTR